MPEPIKYVVVCDCHHDNRPHLSHQHWQPIVGFITDFRPVGGGITVQGERGHYGHRFEKRSRPITEGDYLVVGNFNALFDRRDNTILCSFCGKSAQLSPASAAAVCDRLTPNLDRMATRSTPRLDPRTLDDEDDDTRHEIPLGMLCTLLSHLNR